jgi:uncharacterized protein involved in exopolysaccharide biosynthesis
MQPTEGLSVPRRPLDVEDYIDILRRHKGWILGPFLLTLVASVVGVYLWPDQYKSEAVIQVKPQQVPQNLVQSVVNQDLLDQINTMTNYIKSRSVLTSIIRNFDLYKRDLARRPLEDVIQTMQSNIVVAPVTQSVTTTGARSIAAFSVSFKYENKYDAQKVVQDLVGKFLSQHTTLRSESTVQTRQLLQDEVDRARLELEEKGNRLTAYRAANAGRLPDQLNSATQQLLTLQQSVSMLQASISRANSEKDVAQTNIEVLQSHLEALQREKAPAPVETVSPRLADVNREIESLERSLQLALQRYTEKSPDVRDLRNRLEVLRQNKETILAEEAAKKTNSAEDEPALPANVRREIEETRARIVLLQAQIAQKEKEIEDYTNQFREAQRRIGGYEQRISAIPVAEQEYASLLREEALAREKYQNRVEALNKAQIAAEMEGRNQGESLALLDAATLPNEVEEPNRPLVISVGAGFGLLLGIVIAGAREMKDTSLKNLKDVRVYTQMAILGSIPLLENDFVVRRRRRLAWLGWTVACLLAGLVMAGAIVYYYLTLPTVG